MPEWGEPVELPGAVYVVDARSDGEVLVVGSDEGGSFYAEYFAAL